MLQAFNELYCGIFDSTLHRLDETKSLDRKVPSYELEIFHKEGGISYVNNIPHPTKYGMLLCAKPKQIRHSDFPVRCSFIRIMPKDNRNNDITSILDTFPDCTYIEKEDADELMSLFARLNSCLLSYSGKPIEEIKINMIFLDILRRYAKFMKKESELSSQSSINRICKEAYEYINEHYTSKCSLQDIAQAVKISPNHLHNIFSKHIGITPHEHVTKKRVEKAEQLIAAGEKSMFDIALETGFCSQSHFNKTFKKVTGKTPLQYKNDLPKYY